MFGRSLQHQAKGKDIKQALGLQLQAAKRRGLALSDPVVKRLWTQANNKLTKLGLPPVGRDKARALQKDPDGASRVLMGRPPKVSRETQAAVFAEAYVRADRFVMVFLMAWGCFSLFHDCVTPERTL